MTGLGIEPAPLKSSMFRPIYIWFRDGVEFWAYISFIGGGHTAGWRWDGYSWQPFEIDLRKIDRFIFY